MRVPRAKGERGREHASLPASPPTMIAHVMRSAHLARALRVEPAAAKLWALRAGIRTAATTASHVTTHRTSPSAAAWLSAAVGRAWSSGALQGLREAARTHAPASAAGVCVRRLAGHASPVACSASAAAAASAATTAAAAPALAFDLGAGLSDGARRAVAAWLGTSAALVFSMVVLGGVTRLTRSGLSMTDWRFAGERPPLTEPEWEAEFDKYKRSPEFRRVNLGMGLEDFKFIYWMEWGHRMWGRAIGVVFAVPLVAFAATQPLSAPLRLRIAALFAAGGCQAFVGWWMVKSGLQEPANPHAVPRVSPYRLAAHLTSAFAIYAGLVWTTMQVASPITPMMRAEAAAEAGGALLRHARALRTALAPLAALVTITALSGAFVAGNDAGHAYNTFPLMGGRVVPSEYWDPPVYPQPSQNALEAFVRNALENTAAVQFHHRCLALTTLAGLTGVWWRFRKAPMPAQVGGLLAATAAMAWTQVALGVATLLNHVPVHLGSMHQAGALTLMTLTLGTLYCLKPGAGGARGMLAAWRAASHAAPWRTGKLSVP